MSTPADQTTSRLTFDLLPFLCTLPGRVAKLECENEYLKRDIARLQAELQELRRK